MVSKQMTKSIFVEGDYNNEAIVVYHNPESAIYAK